MREYWTLSDGTWNPCFTLPFRSPQVQRVENRQNGMWPMRWLLEWFTDYGCSYWEFFSPLSSVSLWGVYWSLHRSDRETITANFFTLLCKKVPQTMTNDSLWTEDLFQWLYLQTAFVSPQTGQGCLLWKLPPELFPPTSTLVLLGGHSLKKSLTGTLAHLYIYLIWILYFLINTFAVVVCYRCDWETGQQK